MDCQRLGAEGVLQGRPPLQDHRLVSSSCVQPATCYLVPLQANHVQSMDCIHLSYSVKYLRDPVLFFELLPHRKISLSFTHDTRAYILL